MFSRKVIASAGGVLLFLLAGVGAMLFMPSERPNTTRQSSSTPAKQASSSSTTQASMQPSESSSTKAPAKLKTWYVYVTGEVNRPGVYALSEDSRVFHAVDAAGGFTRRADRSSLNLAEVLADEAHVHVAGIEEATRQAARQETPEIVRIPGYSAQTRVISQTSSSSGLVDINHANVQELQRISGVGPAIAQRIIDYRNQHGAFSKPEDLLNVSGIGQARLNQIRPQITLRGGSSYTTASRVSSTRAASSSGLVDINHANVQELQRISGVGPAIAQRIIDYRNQHGAFSKPEDLLNVRGIGASRLKDIRPQIVIR